MCPRQTKDYPDISLNPEIVADKADFGDIFGRSVPVHIEIGSGRGTFILSQARSQPDISFLGIEWASKYYRHAVDRIGRWKIPNVRIMRTEAADFITNCVPDNSVECFHVYFPDPWPKKRHHKRRFICSENLIQIIRCLKSNGRVNIATDHQDYFQQISDVIAQAVEKGLLVKTDFLNAAGAEPGELVGTNYERKYRKAGRNFYSIAALKSDKHV